MSINYRRNEDRWPERSGISYNLIHSIEVLDESGEVTEPVTLSEMKDYLRVQGFDESGDYSFDDILIQSMITAARERTEVYTGCSLIPKTLTVYLTNLCGCISLPGPVTGAITATDSEGEEIVADDIKTFGDKFPELISPQQEKMKLVYDAGYTTVPKGLKLAIMNEVGYRYENRGDEEMDGLCKAAQVLANPYKRASPFG